MMRSGYRRNRLDHRKAPEQPLLLLFPGCCNDATSTMRIRKGQARWSNASARGEAQSSQAAATGSQPTPPDHNHYMNLDDFVNSLARENCFPDEEFTNHHYKTGESSSLTSNFSRPITGDQPHFSTRVDSRSSVKIDADDVDTSLRLAISPREMAPAAALATSRKSSEGGARIRTTLEVASENVVTENCEQSCRMANTTATVETTEEEVEAGQPDQTMKSSTESMERRCGSRRKRVPVSVSSSPLAGQDSEKRKQKAGLRGESASKRTKTKRERKASSSRSGRPKKLKYMKQENREELGNQCNRSDGKGWTCPLLAKTGYQLCDHHLDKLRCKPGSRSKYYKKKRAATMS